ncbi:unnamed protein product [Ceutorhynchus assimilis]|uniref:MADF domain-containing protein n=1 Tax=Ceutorhynchus assimilis TaxID=467358 RepID=A0A9P0GQF5_9CUCU|nr:unnamed protein product [Ceutorhynchus assimilis]
MESAIITAESKCPTSPNLVWNRKSMSLSKKWRESDTIKFVELYEKSECLWNFRHPAYKNRNARDKAIQYIVDEMNLPDFGSNELKNKIKNIRSTYQQEVNKIKKSKQSFVLEEYKTNLAWFPIADRFLSGVINSAKTTLAKTEEEELTYYQPTESLYSLVETEMTNNEELEQENDGQFEFAPFNINADQIKEEVEDYMPLQQVKKMKLSHLNLNDSNEAQSDEVLTQVQLEDFNDIKDEWYHFGNNVSCQLRNLPLERALMCQKRIVEILTEERLDYIKNLNQ